MVVKGYGGPVYLNVNVEKKKKEKETTEERCIVLSPRLLSYKTIRSYIDVVVLTIIVIPGAVVVIEGHIDRGSTRRHADRRLPEAIR